MLLHSRKKLYKNLINVCIDYIIPLDVRVSYFPQPNIFQSCKTGMVKEAKIFTSLYKLNEFDPVFPSTNNADEIIIDAENLMDAKCLRTISIQPNSAGRDVMGPDNLGFVLSVCNPIVSFFILTAIVHDISPPKLLITLY